MPPQLKVIEIRRLSDEDETLGVWVGQVFDLVKVRTTFGRCSENDIPLFSYDRVRRHGLLFLEGDDCFIEDISDRMYSILVNNERIQSRTLLNDGDVVSVFRVTFEYRKEKETSKES